MWLFKLIYFSFVDFHDPFLGTVRVLSLWHFLNNKITRLQGLQLIYLLSDRQLPRRVAQRNIIGKPSVIKKRLLLYIQFRLLQDFFGHVTPRILLKHNLIAASPFVSCTSEPLKLLLPVLLLSFFFLFYYNI